MLILSSYSFPHYGLERFFRFAQQLGFEAVEITVNENFDTQNPAYLKELSQRFSMPIKAFSMPTEGPERFMLAFQKVVREFPQTTINLTSPEVFSFSYKKWVDEVAPKLAQKYYLKLNRRNTPFKTLLGLIPSRAESSLHTLKEAGDVSLDFSALWQSNEDVMRAIQFLGDKLRHIYLSNCHQGIPFAPLPVGILPLESVLTKLKRNGYRGDFSLKISPENLHEGDDERMVQVLKESKDFFEKYYTNVKLE